MPLATLMVYPTHEAQKNVFAFEHAMAHRNVQAVMGPLTQWTVMPYFIDPTDYQATPANKWNLNHQQAHDDFTKNLPAFSTARVAGIPMNQNLMDTDLQDQSRIAWWTHNNHQQHLVAANAVLPLPSWMEQAQMPWWYLEPRRVQVFW
jgi:hypothetical protein